MVSYYVFTYSEPPHIAHEIEEFKEELEYLNKLKKEMRLE